MKGGLISAFCGAGGLDLGFERAGFRTLLAFDRNPDSIRSYNHNRTGTPGVAEDIRNITQERLGEALEGFPAPAGLIGGPPCQSFSQSNRSPVKDDLRHTLPFEYVRILRELNSRSPVGFFMFENVTGLCRPPHQERLDQLLQAFRDAGFPPSAQVLNAADYGVPQVRQRLIIVGYNAALYPGTSWTPPEPSLQGRRSVRSAIASLPDPALYRRGLAPEDIPHHPNHWCMAPKSKRFFTDGALQEGDSSSRSFKTLSWDRPSITVAYGHREVHVHPSGRRRLSVYEAMKLQGFPDEYQLVGSLSSQITQISEAVPPPLAEAIAVSILSQIAPPAKTGRRQLSGAASAPIAQSR